MDSMEKFSKMEKIIKELENLKNSQSEIVTRIHKIEADILDLNSEELSKVLPAVNKSVTNNLNKINGILGNFEAEKNIFAKANNIQAN